MDLAVRNYLFDILSDLMSEEVIGGLQIVLLILAGKGLFNNIFPYLKKLAIKWKIGYPADPYEEKRFIRLILILIILFSLPSNIYFYYLSFDDILNQRYSKYLPADMVNAFKWLEQNGSTYDIVFCSLNGPNKFILSHL